MTTSEMTPQRWRQVQWLFDAVLSREPAERPEFLDQATAKDPDLRREVDSLIASLQAASRFIDEPAFELTAPTEPEVLAVGTRVGAYRLERLLGSGGAGRVYLASRADQTFEKLVALKVIKRGMDTDDLVRRFLSERQILAQLDHPNIAKLLDGGATEDGRPYLVMESVDGVPIDQWCAEQALGVTDRIELFLSVCQAVQFAHRNLVIHRDLKPGNILVNRDGEPKLLDFGIAKLLSPRQFPRTVMPTAPGWRAMTPEYASPEQVRGEVVTTGTDVYSLGVVLYELLAGRRPYAITAATPTAIETAVCLTEPRRASKVARTAIETLEPSPYGDVEARHIERQLTGDLDDILHMVLEKEVDRRYPTVDQLAADLRRHLDGLPVTARKNTFVYRSTKFVRRNQIAVAAAATVMILLMSFLTALVLQNSQILRQRDRAELVSTVLTDLFEISAPSRQRGETVTARQLLDKGARDIEARLRQQPGLLGELLGTIGTTYRKLGLTSEAQPLLERSVDLISRHYRSHDPAVADAGQRLADLYFALDNYGAAEHLTRQALTLRRERLGEDHLATVESLFRLAQVRHRLGDFSEAEELFSRAEQQARDRGYDELLIQILFRHGLLARYTDHQSAEQLLREALAGAEAFWGDDHPEVALILGQLAEVEKTNTPELAEELLDRALTIQRAVYREPHPDLASTLNNRALLELERGRLDSAEAGFQEALEVQRASHKGESALEAIVLNNIARIHKTRGDLESASQHYRAALTMHTRVFGAGHEETANVLNNLTLVLMKTGELDEAEKLLRESLAILIETFGEQHSRIAVVYNNLGQLARRRGEIDTAQKLFERAAELLRTSSPRDLVLPGVLQNLATIADREGNSEKAMALYLEALDIFTANGIDDSAEAATLFNNLAVAEVWADNNAEAEQWARKALTIYERIQEPGGLDRLRARRLVAAALERQERFGDAEALMQQNIEACRNRWGGEHPECDRHQTTLAKLHTKWQPQG